MTSLEKPYRPIPTCNKFSKKKLLFFSEDTILPMSHSNISYNLTPSNIYFVIQICFVFSFDRVTIYKNSQVQTQKVIQSFSGKF